VSDGYHAIQISSQQEPTRWTNHCFITSNDNQCDGNDSKSTNLKNLESISSSATASIPDAPPISANQTVYPPVIWMNGGFCATPVGYVSAPYVPPAPFLLSDAANNLGITVHNIDEQGRLTIYPSHFLNAKLIG
jgi:hypothetical protein